MYKKYIKYVFVCVEAIENCKAQIKKILLVEKMLGV